MSNALREQIFISYSHQDQSWLDLLLRHLAAIPTHSFEIWSDRHISPGDEWRVTIEKKLSGATMALLLVSDHFLASDFIKRVELPAILSRASERGLKIYWVPLTTTNVKWTPLNEIQACCSPDKPLDLLPPPEQNKVVVGICDLIYSHCKELVRTSEDRRDKLKGEVRQALPSESDLEIDEMISWGDHSIVYRGMAEGREIAVKVLMDSPLREHERHFREAARLAANSTHPCFIRVRDVYVDIHPQCIIMDYVPAPTLADVLQQDGPISIDNVIRLVKEAAEALAEYHANGLVYGPLDSSEILYDHTPLLRLSPLSISSCFTQDDSLNGSFPRDRKAAIYLCPESYAGHLRTSLSDQYALGLLAFEMLEGAPPCRIACPADLAKKSAFFADPAVHAGQWQARHPDLAHVIFRMLHQDPRQRWASMAEVVGAFEVLVPAAVALVKVSYLKNCHNQPPFFADFYRRFFTRCPEAAAMFGDLDDQYKKLGGALNYLLNFKPSPVPQEITLLDPTAEQHQKMNIREPQFDAFFAALIETLKDYSNEDDMTLDAWHKVLSPGFEYLKGRCCAKRVA
jgi:serine/threonine protein kinase